MMTGAWIARDLRQRVMPPIEAFNEDIFCDVLRAFDNLDARAAEQANDFYNNFPADEYTDPGDVADWAQEHSYSWWDTMTSLRQSMINLMAAGLFHLIEQQLAALSLDCGYESVTDTKIEAVERWYHSNLGIDLSSLGRPWSTICELRLVANSVKHAEGRSSKQLRELRPDLFQDPALEHIRAEFGERWRVRNERLARPLAGEDLFVTESDLKNYSAAARALFQGIVDFCEARRDELFPLKERTA